MYHSWIHNAKYGGEICSSCGAVKGTRRGNASCKPSEAVPVLTDKPSVQKVAEDVKVDYSIRQAAMELYKAPFYYSHGYIRDANHQMISDDAGDTAHGLIAARIRGWGRIQYMDNPKGRAAALQDEIGKIVTEALNEKWKESKFSLPSEDACVAYVKHTNRGCRDCADSPTPGICPGSGLPCGNSEAAIRTVVKALRYGIENNYLKD